MQNKRNLDNTLFYTLKELEGAPVFYVELPHIKYGFRIEQSMAQCSKTIFKLHN